ncbi:methyltransferase domain-containing protein [Albidovulum sp.]|uniref:methyltransferase domain-containing protein n=1 Tax=Albidovulum sp. TaxID=1872424 RepID=UPI0025BB9C70|nr:methyltransferase domain-containing protein [Defluviimonas sp.]
MMELDHAEAGQVSASAAEIYDREFVPALFGQFAPMLVEAVRLKPGESVLDVACGTGTVALAAEGHCGQDSRIAAVDINPGMLAVARRKSPRIAWQEAAAEALPFDDDTFDATLCQFALMFFADRTKALREMARVTKPGGRIAISVFESVERSPAYDRLVPLLGDVVGPKAAAALSAPFCLGDPAAVTAELAAAGLTADEVRPCTGTARHASLDAWLDTEIGGWTLAEMVSADQLGRIKEAARDALGAHVGADGSVAFPAPARVLIIRP